MAEFIYLYRGQGPAVSPEEMQKRMERWMVWMKNLSDKGHIKDQGQPLEYSGKVVHAGNIVSDGPFAETKDVIGGFTIIEADNIDQACELTEGCPIFAGGWSIEVRPVMKMGR